MANWNQPTLTSTYTNVIDILKGRDVDVAKMFDGLTPTNIEIGFKRWNSTGNKFERWDGSAWVELSALYEINILGNAGTATLAAQVDLTVDATNTSRRVVFATGASGGQSLLTDPGLTYNPSTNLLSVNVSGISDKSDQVYQNSSGPGGTSYRFLLGLANNNYGVVYNGAGIEYSLITNKATINISGNADTATNATNATNATTANNALNIDGNDFTNSDVSNPIAGPDNLLNNGLGYTTGVSLFGQADGGLYGQFYDTTFGHQIFGDYRSGQIAVRGLRQDAGVGWTAWRSVLDSGNFNSYAPTLTGLGASGNWNINAANGITPTTGSPPYYGARAWVSFNGTGTPAIRASGNVTSITDLDVGVYRVNMGTNMPDTNYTVSTSGTYTTSGPTLGAMFPFLNAGTRVTPNVGNFTITCQNFAGSRFDEEYMTMCVFR